MIYLGTIGRMVPIKCPTQQRGQVADRYSFMTTLGGEVKAQAGPKGRRAWDVNLGRLTTPSEVGALMEFANGSWGPGPFWFLPADAPVVNMLTEDAAKFDPSLISGSTVLGAPPMPLGDDGVAARSLWKIASGSARIDSPVPIVRPAPVTGSAWVIGSGRVRLEFLDINQNVLSVHDSPPGRDVAARQHVTVSPPGDAVAARLAFTAGITQAARPAITATPQLFEWGDGQGCDKAIVHQATRDVTKAWANPKTGRWSEISFTIQEVG